MRIKRQFLVLLLAGYLAGIYHGRIALWKGEDPEPIAVLPYCVQMLPKADRIALHRGIHMATDEELIHFMEDFCS